RPSPRPVPRGHGGTPRSPRPLGGTLTAKPTRSARVAAILLVLLTPFAWAREAIESGPFEPGSFRGLDQALATCASAQPSFLCHYEDDELTRVSTKGTDFVFTPAGEVAAAFVKVTRGQELNELNLTAGNNLIPFDAAAPGGALLVDGAWAPPEGARGERGRTHDASLTGTFTYRAGDLLVERTVVLTSVSETVAHTLVVRRAGEAAGEPAAGDPAAEGAAAEDGAAANAGGAGAGGELLLQVAMPGIARVASPVVKVGYGDTFAMNPGERPFDGVTYVALQKSNRNNEQALIMLPRDGGAALAGAFVRPNFVALQAALPAGQDEVTLAVDVYAGPNELVRYTQEG